MTEAARLLSMCEEKVIGYHGTDSQFDSFREVSQSTNSHTFGQSQTTRHGIFFSSNSAFAAEYGQKVRAYILTMNNSAKVSEVQWDFVESLDAFKERDLWLLAKHVHHDWQLFDGEVGERFVQWLRSQGYDSAVFDEALPTDGGEVEGITYVVFSNSQIQPARGGK